MSSLSCPRCGSPIKPASGDHYVTCDSCQTVIYIDRSGFIFNYIMPFVLSETDATAVFRRWAKGPSLAKNLETNAKITEIEKIYFPLFSFRRVVNGIEKTILKPAKGTMLPGLQNQIIPPGETKIFNSEFIVGDAKVISPEINIETYLPTLSGTQKEQSVLYLPFYIFKYRYQGVDYTSVMGGTSGRVYTAGFPGRSATPYTLVMGGGFFIAFIGGVLGYLTSPIFYALVFAGAVLAMFTGRVVVHSSGSEEV